MPAPRGERTQLGCKDLEINLGLTAQRPSQNVAYLGLCGTPVPRGAALEPREELVLEISNAEARHYLARRYQRLQ